MDPAVNPARPFCSARCKTIDFGQWVDGSYAIAGDPVDPDTGQPVSLEDGQKPGPSGGDA
jgi:endogenous inhibitor of DNA gyrase (YacG/DUF329 family)